VWFFLQHLIAIDAGYENSNLRVAVLLFTFRFRPAQSWAVLSASE
jgi:hypothetical protein